MNFNAYAFASKTPKAFANFSPGFERGENPGISTSPSDQQISFSYPGLSLRSNPGLKLANAFGVITECRSGVNPVRGLTTFWAVLYSSRSRFIR